MGSSVIRSLDANRSPQLPSSPTLSSATPASRRRAARTPSVSTGTAHRPARVCPPTTVRRPTAGPSAPSRRSAPAPRPASTSAASTPVPVPAARVPAATSPITYQSARASTATSAIRSPPASRHRHHQRSNRSTPIRAIRRRAPPTRSARTAAAPVWQTWSAIRTPAVAPSAFSAPSVRANRLASATGAPIRAPVRAPRTPSARCTITSRCAAARPEWRATHSPSAGPCATSRRPSRPIRASRHRAAPTASVSHTTDTPCARA